MYAGAMKDNLPETRLILENVSHDYGGLPVLQHINFSVTHGEFVVIVGPSGCGKTTLLNLLSGFIKPVSGHVQINGVIRTVYQQDGLFPWLTVSENIEMGLRSFENIEQRKKEIKELIELIRLEGFENNYPHQLSGGMRQRVELARVLSGDSDILLMDEPFSALDYQTRLRMRHELVRVLGKRPRTVVFVTHDIEEAAQLADRVIVLSNRPAKICRQLNINSPRPRNPTDDAVVEATKAILTELGL
ncbi:MAG TPA: ABC transporter ATP-binding protein [Puia sp.]|jgi:NitT/TauT family transport system ATP-binding protein|nr:ABC transporter ATP-binding protein [Puia sp.]